MKGKRSKSALVVLTVGKQGDWVDQRRELCVGETLGRLLKEIAVCETAVREIETDLRLRAMSNDANDKELALLRRLKDERADLLYRCQNLREAFIALLGENDIAAE